MTEYFLGCLGIYLVVTLIVNAFQKEDDPKRSSPISVLIQAPLFLLALYITVDQETLSRELVSLPRILAGLLLGHVVFAVSIVLTQGSLGGAVRQFTALGAVIRFLSNNPMVIIRFLMVSLTEEIIYRAAAQPLLIEKVGSPLWGILAVAVIFSVTHWHFFRNPPMQSLEFVLFALLLGGLYYATGSLALVVMIHGVRNMEIVYLEYLVHKDKLGSAQAAQDEIDANYATRRTQAS